MPITAPTPDELHAIAEHALTTPHQAADAIQDHDAGEEADPELQDGLHRLAERCSQCGQTLPEAAAAGGAS